MPSIYHITHFENLPTVARHGGLFSDLQCQAMGMCGRTIGYDHIKQRRMEHQVPKPPGGSLGDYVPFYFAPRSPMLFTIHHRNTIFQGGQEPVVHLVSSVEAVSARIPPLAWMFTDGHAVIDLSEYYVDISDLDKVDWDIMTAKYWRDTLEDGDRVRRRQAEFLVYQFFPWELISEIAVIDSKIEAHVKQMLADVAYVPKIVVRRDWYYS